VEHCEAPAVSPAAMNMPMTCMYRTCVLREPTETTPRDTLPSIVGIKTIRIWQEPVMPPCLLPNSSSHLKTLLPRGHLLLLALPPPVGVCRKTLSHCGSKEEVSEGSVWKLLLERGEPDLSTFLLLREEAQLVHHVGSLVAEAWGR